MKKNITLLLVTILLVSVISAAFAADLCDRSINGSACNKPLSWVNSGASIEYSTSHKYGGFLGLFQGTCNYKYYKLYKHYQCTRGHVQDMKTIIVDYDHDACGA